MIFWPDRCILQHSDLQPQQKTQLNSIMSHKANQDKLKYKIMVNKKLSVNMRPSLLQPLNLL
jgi:hypothetical protein